MKEALILHIIQPEKMPVIMGTHKKIFLSVQQKLIRLLPLFQVLIDDISCGKINRCIIRAYHKKHIIIHHFSKLQFLPDQTGIQFNHKNTQDIIPGPFIQKIIFIKNLDNIGFAVFYGNQFILLVFQHESIRLFFYKIISVPAYLKIFLRKIKPAGGNKGIQVVNFHTPLSDSLHQFASFIAVYIVIAAVQILNDFFFHSHIGGNLQIREFFIDVSG